MSRCSYYATECKRGCTDKCAAENAFRPSNGAEGMDWMEDYCFRCIHDNPYLDNGEQLWRGRRRCEILTASLCFYPTDPEYPKEWIMKNGQGHCTAHVRWDWGTDGDPDDPDNPKAPVPYNPNQLEMFPLSPTELDFQPKQQPHENSHNIR